MSRIQPRKIALALVAPVVAVIVAFLVTSLILFALGDPVMQVWQVIFQVPGPRVMVNLINSATVFYISAIAVAIGFRMNLFNIGVDGQYRVAAFAAAVFAGQAWLPGFLNIIVALIVAMCAGGLWAGIAAYLKVKRGISEVISTIMLNATATALVAYLLSKMRDPATEGTAQVRTRQVPEDARLAGFDLIPQGRGTIYTLILLAALVGFAYWFVLNKTRFGFDLRATGKSETAAVASGVNVKKMMFISMALSGAVAGLVGMPLLFGSEPYAYGNTFQAGLGFAGIAIALLGRNNAIGIAFAAVLWAFLSEQSNGLQIQAGVAPELVFIIQGVILFAVVIAYEVVRRAEARMEQTRVAKELADARAADATREGASA